MSFLFSVISIKRLDLTLIKASKNFIKQIFLHIMGLVVGALLSIWSIWILKEYQKLPPADKRLKKAQLLWGL